MTERHHIWLRKDEHLQERHGAVRADTITVVSTMKHEDGFRLLVTADGKAVDVGFCRAEHRDHMVNGLLSVLCQAENSDAGFVVIEAVPQADQDGPDQTFFWVYENEWPITRQPASPAVR